MTWMRESLADSRQVGPGVLPVGADAVALRAQRLLGVQKDLPAFGGVPVVPQGKLNEPLLLDRRAEGPESDVKPCLLSRVQTHDNSVQSGCQLRLKPFGIGLKRALLFTAKNVAAVHVDLYRLAAGREELCADRLGDPDIRNRQPNQPGGVGCACIEIDLRFKPARRHRAGSGGKRLRWT